MDFLGKILSADDLINKKYVDEAIPTTLPASDVYAWAKAATKPPYTKEEVGLGNVDNKSSATIRGEITATNVTNALGYTPLSTSGGALTNNSYSTVLALSGASSSLIEFQQKGTKLGAIGYNSNGVPVAMTGASYVNLIHSGNYSDYALPLSGGTMNLGSTIKWNHDNEENWNTSVKGLKILRYASTANLSTNGSFANYAAGLHIANSTTYAFQIAYNAGYGDANYNESLRYRGYTPNGKVWGAWKTIAFTDSTVASANQTMRFKGVASSGDLNTVLAGGGMARTYSSYLSADFTNAPSDSRYGAVLQLSTYGFVGLESLSAQLAWDVNHGSTTDTTRYLWWRVADSSNVFKYAKWHQIAFVDSNVASATKLQTARTIWGQSFDGTGNVSGSFYINNESPIHIYDSAGTGRNALYLSGGNNLWIGYGTSAAQYNTIIAGYNTYFRYGGNSNTAIFINSSGNVGIGTESPQAKLHVNGNAVIKGDTSTGSDIRFKDKITDHRIAISDIAEAPLFTFKWNDREDKTEHLGSSAQYWEKVTPWLVKGEDFKTLDYSTLGVAIGISLANKTLNLEDRVKILEEENKFLKEQIRRINHGS